MAIPILGYAEREIMKTVSTTWSHGAVIKPSAARARLVKLKFIEGKPMKNGHRKGYYLTPAGRDWLEGAT